MTKQPTHPVNLSLLECMWLLRRLRADRDKLKEDLLAIEERVRGGHNGDLISAHRAIDGDLAIADEILRKLWQTCGP